MVLAPEAKQPGIAEARMSSSEATDALPHSELPRLNSGVTRADFLLEVARTLQ